VIAVRRASQRLFAGLNPERIMGASFALVRLALERSVEYANARKVWDETIGAHHGMEHRLFSDRWNGWLCRITRGRHGYVVRFDDDWDWTGGNG
jgi:hypothetical protein